MLVYKLTKSDGTTRKGMQWGGEGGGEDGGGCGEGDEGGYVTP